MPDLTEGGPVGEFFLPGFIFHFFLFPEFMRASFPSFAPPESRSYTGHLWWVAFRPQNQASRAPVHTRSGKTGLRVNSRVCWRGEGPFLPSRSASLGISYVYFRAQPRWDPLCYSAPVSASSHYGSRDARAGSDRDVHGPPTPPASTSKETPEPGVVFSAHKVSILNP